MTDAERERLALLIEEAAEVQQIACKILRHGYDSHHPKNPNETNRDLLRRELADFLAALSLMTKDEQDIRPIGVVDIMSALDRKFWYMRHQDYSPQDQRRMVNNLIQDS